jgi:exosortase D (VPLPA-CTERM-specific)
VLIILALAMHIIGELSATFILSQIGFVIALMGVILATGGYSLLKISFIPIAFLLFAIPLPYFVDSALTLQLQLVSSQLGVFVIRMFAIPVYLDGNIIDLGDYKLQVVEACSGLRYLYPLLSLSFLAAYLFHAPLWQRALVFLSGIPIAIGMNGFRIGLVGILIDRWGSQMADGALHFFEGWAIFVACTAVLTLEVFILARFSGRALSEVFYIPRIVANPPAVLDKPSRDYRPLTSCLLLLCAGGLAVFATSGRTEPVQDRTRFAEFPAQLGQWQGRSSLLDPETEKALGVNDYILSDYVGPDGQPINFYVAYYDSQRKGESPHSPIVCIPGGGWAITKLQQINYTDGADEQPLNRVIIEKGIEKQLVYYWFDERGRKIASEWWAKFYLLSDAILRNRTDAALIRLTTQILPGETEQGADRRLQSFMRHAIPKLSAFLSSGANPQQSSVNDVSLGRQS